MTRVRRLAALAVLTPLVTGTLALGAGAPARADTACGLTGSAEISSPSSVAPGQTFRVSATTRGLVLSARLVVAGQTIDRGSGTLSGSARLGEPGVYPVSVIGNFAGCTYRTRYVSVRKRTTSTPAHGRADNPASGKPDAGRPKGSSTPGNVPGKLPKGSGSAPSPAQGVEPPKAPFSLPSAGPGETAPGFRYPTPEPQVATPNSHPQARNASSADPINWGQSIAVALVLLLLSAHLGMWSRRQRLAAAPRGTGEREGGAQANHRRSGSGYRGRRRLP